MTQQNKILNELKKGKFISNREMEQNFNINSPQYVIWQLRKNYNIDSLKCRNKKTNTKYIKYFLIDKDVRRKF
jgi:hypothetical protein